MKISEKWLRSFVKINRPIQEVAEILTMRGLEVEEIAPVAGKLDNIVVAEILSAEKHPNADRLRVCQVNDGSETLTIVCGAPNARAGIKVALAKIGAVLPGVTIKKSKIRDVESHGMLCSVSELGLADKSEGIMELPSDAPVGISLVDYLDLDDNVLDISITPNRGDCASVLGIAREIAAIENEKLLPSNTPFQTEIADSTGRAPLAPTKVQCNNLSAQVCAIYLTNIIQNINPAISSPIGLKEKLRRSGVRSINVPVDVTNYVMFELGQPLHAFDAEKVKGNITVRFAQASETLELLNESKINLDEASLIIADEEGPIALAGIMGGKRTAVSETTKNILLESAHFSPENIARTARHFNLNSDSSYRFERGVDPALPHRAIELATQMILEIAGGAVLSLDKEGDQPVAPASSPSAKKIPLRYAKLTKVIGKTFSENEIEAIFSSLQMSFEKNSEGLLVTIPSYRFDLTIEEDLIEEVLRIYGCDKIEAVAPRPSLLLQSNLNSINVDAERLLLKTRGYSEIISYSFVDEKLQTLLFPNEKVIKLVNPISQEMGVMRTSLWPGLISTLIYNINQQQPCIRFFEVGLCFGENNQQRKKIAGLSYEKTLSDKESGHFFDVKNEMEAILAKLNLTSEGLFLPTEHSVNNPLHPRQSAHFVRKERVIATIGVLHPRLVEALELSTAPILFEINLEAIESSTPRKQYQPLSKFPSAERDLSFMMPIEVTYQEIQRAILGLDDDNRIRYVTVFDVFRGPGIPEGKKSMGIRLILQDFNKTLTNEEIAAVMKKVIDLIQNQFNATLRD